MRYIKPKDGEWVQPIRSGYKLMCCDCSLTHTVDFRIVKTGRGNFVQFRVSRNYRSTAAARRNLAKIIWKRKKVGS